MVNSGVMPFPGFADRLADVRRCIADARARGGHGQAVRLIAVTKTHGPEAVELAYAHGIADVGENKVQEAQQKMAAVAVPVRWHLIGHLQRNKVKFTAPFALVHGVDSRRLAEELDAFARKRGVVADVLMQVNVSGESTKGGLAPAEWAGEAAHWKGLTGLAVRGVMTMAPFGAPEATLRAVFAGGDDGGLSGRGGGGGHDGPPRHRALRGKGEHMTDDAFRLTPLDVRRYDFGTALRGYDKVRVDQFRDQVANELERLSRQIADLETRANGFLEQLRAFRERDKALNEALVSAQQLRAEIREQAEREAGLILREARAEGERILQVAREQVQALRQEAEQMEKARRTYLLQFRALTERQLAEVEAIAKRPPSPVASSWLDAPAGASGEDDLG